MFYLLACAENSVIERSLSKQKLMKTNVQARQLGGAEAWVGLVCCHHNLDSLQSRREVATANQEIAVFGRVDLMNSGDGAPHRLEGDRILE